LLSLLDALPGESPFLNLDPPQRRRRILEALKRRLLCESQEQPLLLVFEDLHWIDAETQALLDSLVESLPTAQLLLLVNYRPEYQHAWGSKTSYTQLRLELRNALWPLGQFRKIREILHEADTFAVRLDDPRRLGRVAVYLCVSFYGAAQHNAAVAAGERALALSIATGDSQL
jgi:hypothetical protein